MAKGERMIIQKDTTSSVLLLYLGIIIMKYESTILYAMEDIHCMRTGSF